jgi:type 1 glutamine amidotransferase
MAPADSSSSCSNGKEQKSGPVPLKKAKTVRVISRIKRLAIGFSILLCLALAVPAAESDRRILVYTKNGKGFVHDNIPSSVKAIQKLGVENQFAVDVSEDPAVFTDANLKRYKALVFSNTNNEIFDTEDQKEAMQRYIRGGGGFVGIHSATGSMRKWPWFWALVGGKFVRHPKMQTFTIHVKDRNDISTAHLGEKFQWTDEFYFVDNMPAGLHVLLAGDLVNLQDPAREKYPGKEFGDEFPLAWRHEFDGGRSWYTALGHKPEHYSDPLLMKHILGGILWAMGQTIEKP